MLPVRLEFKFTVLEFVGALGFGSDFRVSASGTAGPSFEF